MGEVAAELDKADLTVALHKTHYLTSSSHQTVAKDLLIVC